MTKKPFTPMQTRSADRARARLAKLRLSDKDIAAAIALDALRAADDRDYGRLLAFVRS